jgi:hypothetical protein
VPLAARDEVRELCAPMRSPEGPYRRSAVPGPRAPRRLGELRGLTPVDLASAGAGPVGEVAVGGVIALFVGDAVAPDEVSQPTEQRAREWIRAAYSLRLSQEAEACSRSDRDSLATACGVPKHRSPRICRRIRLGFVAAATARGSEARRSAMRHSTVDAREIGGDHGRGRGSEPPRGARRNAGTKGRRTLTLNETSRAVARNHGEPPTRTR